MSYEQGKVTANKITDLAVNDDAETKACAEEMMISEEMLGYTIARLDEYAAEVVFDGDTCTIRYESFK